MTQPQAAAGWYQNGPNVEQWWDGTQWGPQTRPIPQPVQRMPRKAITYQPRRTGHAFHLIMTILTGGLWGIFVWLPITLLHKASKERVVTRYR